MYIDKSFQLLSTDSGKLATDEASRQDPSLADAEFSDLFGAELDSQLQDAAGADKKPGQEVAALLTQQGQTTEKLLADQSLVAETKPQASLAGATDAAQVAAAANKLESEKGSNQDEATDHNESADLEKAQAALLTSEAEQATTQNPWLAIINQSHDFNAILSQTAAAVSKNELALSKTETLVADLLGLPVAAPETIAVDANGRQSALDAAAVTGAELSAATMAVPAELSGNTATEQDKEPAALSDPTMLKYTTGPAADPQATTLDSARTDSNSRSGSENMPKLPSEEVSLQQHLKTMQPHAVTSPVAATDNAAESAAGAKMSQLTNGNTTAAATTQASVSQLPAEVVATHSAATEQPSAKSEVTRTVGIEPPIALTPDEPALVMAAVPGAAAAAAASPAKNAPQSFAQFQKAANAAAALMQKQQLQSEQGQGQPVHELAVQQTQRVAEVSQSLPGAHTDTPITLTTLLQTDRPISAGSAMGSSTGQHQQQAASQLFAAKLNDQINHSEQPALQLLEPNAATQLKERVMYQVNQKIQSAEIKLAPEELGSMQIKVQLQQEQLSVQFVVQQAGAKEALEQQMPRLREMLEEQGMQLTDGQVSQQRERADDQKQARQGPVAAGLGSDLDDEPQQQQAMVRVSERMVDYYA